MYSQNVWQIIQWTSDSDLVKNVSMSFKIDLENDFLSNKTFTSFHSNVKSQ